MARDNRHMSVDGPPLHFHTFTRTLQRAELSGVLQGWPHLDSSLQINLTTGCLNVIRRYWCQNGFASFRPNTIRLMQDPSLGFCFQGMAVAGSVRLCNLLLQ